MSAIRRIQNCNKAINWPEDKVKTMTRRFAPIVYLDSKETWCPSSIEWYLSKVTLCFEHDNNVVLQVGEITPAKLIGQEKEGFSSGAEKFDFDKFRWYLRIPDHNRDLVRRGEPVSNGAVNASCYVHIRTAPEPSSIDIQYWFFYPYNGDILEGPASAGTHDADWEHITVRIDGTTDVVRSVYYARHGDEAKWAKPEECLDPSGRPIVYSALNSHASYWTPGTQYREDTLDLADDHTNRGPCWDTAQHLVPLNDNPLVDQANPWNRFSGHWGGSKGGGLFGSKSPESPGFKESWCIDK